MVRLSFSLSEKHVTDHRYDSLTAIIWVFSFFPLPSSYPPHPSVCAELLNPVQLFVDAMNCSLPGYFVHAIFQTRIL